MSFLASEVELSTGVPRTRLRRWAERGIATPTGRTAGGQARYTEADVRRVKYLGFLRTQNVPRPQAEGMLDALLALVEADLEQARTSTAEAVLSALRKQP